ncbi:MAG: PHB depolymerase family esterase [Pseudomonadota bacterium]
MLRLILLLVCLAAPAFAERQEVQLGDRSYLIDLPDRPAGAPVILALHGGGGNPAQFARNSRLAQPALAEGYAVIWPAGTARFGRFLTWNAGYCCGYAAESGVDDAAFLDTVLADAGQRFGLDVTRTYLTGMSNGAIMAASYAAQRPGKIRAVATVSGTMDASLRVRGPVPLLAIHGTADTQVPYAGGRGANSLAQTDFSPVEAMIAAFRRPLRGQISEDAQLIDPEADGTSVMQTDWTDGKGRVLIRLLKVEGGGHTWPGGRRSARQGGTADIVANAEILHFFSLHP